MTASGLPAVIAAPKRDAAVRQRALVVLAVGLGILALLFQAEARAAIETWSRSTAFNHCWLVLPVAGWLAWTRRHRVAGLLPEPAPLLGLAALPFAAAWLVAERLGIMEGRQLAALGMVEVLLLAVLGWRICRAMAAPLAYLVFLVPFGAFLVPQLQDLTAAIIVMGLRLAGVTHYADGLVIEIPAGIFYVAEACAGLRFVIASLAFGALYAAVMFKGIGRRLIVLVLAVVVPVLANGLRALGIVLLGHHLGSAEAAAADHVIYGWGFFSVVMLLLVLAGLPFRQDGVADLDTPAPRGDGGFRTTRLAAAAALPLIAGGAVLAMASWANAAGAGGPAATAAVLVAPPGCVADRGPDGLRCADAVVAGRLLVFPARVTWAAVAAERGRVAGDDDEAGVFTVATEDAVWHVRHGSGGAGMVAVAVWLAGRPAGDGLRTRATQAWNGLWGGHGRPVMAVVSWRGGAGAQSAAAGQRERALMRRLLEAQTPGLVRQASALSRTP